MGLEYDSNATRLDVADTQAGQRPVGSALLRGQAHVAVRLRPARTLHLRASYDLAGKVFFREAARGQDTLLHRLLTGVAARLGDGVAAQVAGLYHEGFQRDALPTSPGAGLLDFRLLEARAALTLAATPWLLLSTGGGLQRFVYKPEPSLSFDAVMATAALQGGWTLGAGTRESELEASLGYSLARRTYDAPMERLCTTQTCHAQCEADPDCDPALPITFAYPGSHREDLVHRLALRLAWIGSVLLSASYALGVSTSNSFGLSYLRHDAKLRCVSRLPWRLYLTAQIRLRLISTEVPGGVDAKTLGFEEENHSHLLLQLERRLHTHWVLVARYTLFAGDLKRLDAAALRHLGYIGVTFRYPAP